MTVNDDLYEITASPHAHDRSGVDRIMLNVCLALTPTTLFGFYLFGLPAIILWTITCLSAVATEALCLKLMNRPVSAALDSSALLTGWLLALSLPPWAPWWIGVGGAAFAIALGKQLYGGIGQNLFNPAMLARVALLISFPVQMTTWANIMPLGSADAPGLQESLAIIFGGQTPDGTTGATILGQIKAATEQTTVSDIVASSYSLRDAFLGETRGSMGETSGLLILLGGAWLLYKRIISWHIPVAMVATLAVLCTIGDLRDETSFAGPIVEITSGGFLFAVFFIATDYVTSPASNAGKIVFGVGCSIVLFTIRSWGGFPEAIAFAVLFMNAFTPIIDRTIRPRVYGRDMRGKALTDIPDARRVL